MALKVATETIEDNFLFVFYCIGISLLDKNKTSYWILRFLSDFWVSKYIYNNKIYVEM